MPNIKSAEKRVEVAKTKNLRNRMIKSNIRTTVKKYESALGEGDVQASDALLRQCVSSYDKAAAKGMIHKNAVNRKKARLARLAASSKE